ncbi:MAG: GMC family oxidoreductase [Porticoccaceae bacterium]|nr:MAG: GMC family oxidoreductase [Porticoccaceae bacterium]
MSQAPQFDAIVVGSGITGGFAAKELTERGLKVLVLERGRMVEHGRDYVGEHLPPWRIPYRGLPLRELYARDYPVQSTLYAFDETTRHYFVNDRENPYEEGSGKFLWYRADVVGGKSLLWGRQTYRFSDLDFEANQRDGHGIDWPIRYADLAPWYDHVERFIGVSGSQEGIPHLPDGQFLPPMELNVMEKTFKARVEAAFPERRVIIGRCAVLTVPHNGRGACHYCGPCQRGCSVGAYFSSQSSTLPAAARTGNLTLLPNSVVTRIDYDAKARRATGVQAVDARTGERRSYTARLIFLCAGTVATTQLLLASRSAAFPRGLANSSGALGHYLMDHTFGTGAVGIFADHPDKVVFGNRPNGLYIPRFRNLAGDEGLGFVRGYGYQGGALRMGWQGLSRQVPGFGAEFKAALRRPGPWMVYLSGFGECLPRRENRIELHPRKKDRFGLPLPVFHFQWSENERALMRDVEAQARLMLERAGAKSVQSWLHESAGGEAIHEMGTARMGDDPRQAVLNRYNQAHDVPNLFVTDGAAMTSSSCVNPSLTYMALTARAADYAARRLAEGGL